MRASPVSIRICVPNLVAVRRSCRKKGDTDRQTYRQRDTAALYYSRLSSLITCAHCTYPFASENFYLSLQRHQRSLGMCRHYYHQSTDWSELRPSMSLCKIEVSVPLSIHFLAYWLASFHHVFGRPLDLVPGISVLNNVLTMCS